EIEYRGTRAHIVGEEGRGIATLIEMAHLTRFDIVVASAGMMRAALNQAIHHAAHRKAFGRRLAEQPLMQNVLADLSLETEAAALANAQGVRQRRVAGAAHCRGHFGRAPSESHGTTRLAGSRRCFLRLAAGG